MIEPSWTVPLRIALPTAPEVHIWQANLNLPSVNLQQLTQLLAVDEQQRAERFRFQHDRQRFIASRGILRTLLGRYLKLEPGELQFCYGANGKPGLNLPQAHVKLQFNVSHSQDLMLCAIAEQHQIGIDVEYLRPIADLASLSRRFFSPQEHKAIQALPLNRQLHSFFQHWTCKEALLKAVGKGLVNLSAVEIAITQQSIKLVRFMDEQQPIRPWQLYSFIPVANSIAAIAVEQNDSQLVFWQWQNEFF